MDLIGGPRAPIGMLSVGKPSQVRAQSEAASGVIAATTAPDDLRVADIPRRRVRRFRNAACWMLPSMGDSSRPGRPSGAGLPHPDRDSLERRHAINRETPPRGHPARDTAPGCARHGIRLAQGHCAPGANRSGRADAGSRRSEPGLAADTRRSRSPRDPRVDEGRPGVPSRTLSTDRLGGRMAHASAWHTSRRALTAATRSIARLDACVHRVFAPRPVRPGAPARG